MILVRLSASISSRLSRRDLTDGSGFGESSAFHLVESAKEDDS